MKNFELIKSFMGKTTVYPSGIEKQSAAPFETKDLKNVVSMEKSEKSIEASMISDVRSARR